MSNLAEYLKAIADGETADLPEPNSALAVYLKAIIDGNTDVPEPNSVLGAYLYTIAKNGGMSGGGTGGSGNLLEFEEKELSFAPLAEGEMPMNTDCGLTELKEGATYDVSWDGTVYTCTTHRVDADGAYILAMGNGAFITGEQDEIPFMFMYDAMGVMGMPSGVIVASLFDENPTHTVGVKFNFTAGGGGDAENDTPFALITATTQRGGNAVAGANVTATNGTTQITGTTDENGQCVLKVSESGTYTITSTYDGYTATNRTSVTVGSLSYTATAMTFFEATITVGTETGATVTVEKDGKVQTAVCEDMEVTFTVYESGTYNVTSEYNGYSETTQINVTTSKNYSILVYASPVSLENSTWDTINRISTSGDARNYFAVGDTKRVELKGTVGTVVLDTTLLVYILGFDHNSAKEGKGISFGGFKTTDGVDVALVDQYYGQKWYSNSPNKNLWFARPNGTQDLYQNIFYNTDASHWTNSSSVAFSSFYYDFTNAIEHLGNKGLLSALPSELKNVLKCITKYKKETGGGDYTYKAHIHLLGRYEVFGTHSMSNPTNYWEQYEYYANGNTTIKYKHNAEETCIWLIEPYDYYSLVGADGAFMSNTNDLSHGIAPVFVV